MSSQAGIKGLRKGPKAKSVALKPRSLKTIAKNKRKSHTREFKLQVLTYLQHPNLDNMGKEVPKTLRGVAKEFGITLGMLQEWQKKEKDILASPVGSQKVQKSRVGKWEEMEKLLYERFLAKRLKGEAIGMRWFRIEGKKIFQELALVDTESKFSPGWFRRFTERWNIAWRMKTKTSQKAPEDKEEVILFLYTLI